MKEEVFVTNTNNGNFLDPKSAYLLGLGRAISNLVEKETDAYWFNNADRTAIRKLWIDDIHRKAMEVLGSR